MSHNELRIEYTIDIQLKKGVAAVEIGCFSGYLIPASDDHPEQLALLIIDVGLSKGRNSSKFTEIALVIDQDSLFRYVITLTTYQLYS